MVVCYCHGVPGQELLQNGGFVEMRPINSNDQVYKIATSTLTPPFRQYC
jgi:hypothetical protein